jgi:hypothetical protein
MTPLRRPLPALFAAAFAAWAASCDTLPATNGGGPAAKPERRLVVLSLDGLPWELAQRKMAEGKMPRLAALVARGAHVEGSVSCFPAITAPGHATLWTGAWADAHGVLGNETPRTPRLRWSALDVRSGFEAAALRSEPIWRAAARAGRTVTVVQATHAEPDFTEDSGLDRLVIFNGYRDRVPSALVTGPTFQADGRTFTVARDGDGVVIACPPARVRVALGETAAVDHPDVRGVFYVHLAHLDDASHALLRSSYNAVAAPAGEDAARFRKDVGGYAYNASRLDVPLWDGTEWKRRLYVAAARLNVEQVRRATIWALEAHPADLTIAYLPQPDEALHALFGRATLWNDRAAIQTIDEVLASCDELVGALEDALGPSDALAVVSDHGMWAANRVFYPNLALERAGLLARNASGGVDLAATQVLFAGGGDFLVVNTVDRRGGIVPPEEKEAWLAQAERELAKAAEGSLAPPVRPAATADVPVSPEGDSWLSSVVEPGRPGVYLSADLPPKGSPLFRDISPIGFHSGDPRPGPLRAVMIFAGAGFRRGASARDARHVDFAPTVARWLGVDPPFGCAGRALEDLLEAR